MVRPRLLTIGAHSAARSPNDVEQVLRHLVCGRDHLGVRGIGLLRHDQFRELGRDVGVGRFERLSDDLAGRSCQRRAGFIGQLIGAAVERLQIVGAVEVNQRHLGERDVLPVGERADDVAGIAHRD